MIQQFEQLDIMTEPLYMTDVKSHNHSRKFVKKILKKFPVGKVQKFLEEIDVVLKVSSGFLNLFLHSRSHYARESYKV